MVLLYTLDYGTLEINANTVETRNKAKVRQAQSHSILPVFSLLRAFSLLRVPTISAFENWQHFKVI